MTEWAKLIERLEKAEAGSRELDAHLFAYVNGGRIHWISETSGELVWEKPIDGFWIRRPSHLKKMPRYSTSLDAAVALVERLLPGWLYSVCHCHVSDDAWLMPDFNDPAHSERLMRKFGQVEGDPSQYWQDVTDVALHPPRGLALALCLALLKALEAVDARK